MTIGSHVPLSTLAKLFQTGEWSVALSDDVEEDETQKGDETRITLRLPEPLTVNSQKFNLLFDINLTANCPKASIYYLTSI